MNKNDEKVFEYIELLDGANYGEIVTSGKTEDGISIFPYAKYSELVYDYLNDFSRSSFVRYDYVETFVEVNEKPIESLNKEELCCLLTAYTRGDRFVEGYLLTQLENGNLIKALKCLKEILVQKK